jgi:NAD(P)-dependent dehydrogenase (short-subunit alcohol dehydrogenase family)
MSGKVVIVTGAGRGIGRAIALELASGGHSVVAAARSLDQLEGVTREIARSAGSALAVPTDVTVPSEVDTLIEKALDTYDRIDAIVNNAGSFRTIGPTWETDVESFWGDITVNIKGPYLVCRAAVPHMLSAGKGTVINMIGGGTGTPFPYGNAYGTSKAALMRFTESLAAELKEHGISVFATGPGLVRTEMTEYQVVTDAGKRWLPRITKLFEQGVDRPPEDAARLIRRLVEGDYFALTGRHFGPTDDPAEVIKQADEILEHDLRTLRFHNKPER